VEITQILNELERNTGTFPREAVEAAMEKREAITSDLLKILEDTVTHAKEIVAKDPDGAYFAHLYAMFLSAQFRETRAYPLVVQFARLEEDLLEVLAGQFITEGLSRVLASVCGGDTRPIEDLIEDPDVHEYVRSAALRSLLALVKTGDRNRDEVMTYFKALFEGRLERSHSQAWNALAACATRLHPGKVYEHLATAYEEGLVDPAFISPRNVEKALKQDKESVLRELPSFERGYIENVADEMAWWACFEQPKLPARRTKPLAPSPTGHAPSEPYQPRRSTKIKPNERCPCGSGKKYKKCCGRLGKNSTDATLSGGGPTMTYATVDSASLQKDAEYVVERAQAGIASVVAVGIFVFFSTGTGDAWLLDSDGGDALCLAKGREAQPYTIMNTSGSFLIGWDAEYSIVGEEFVVTEASGRMRRILGYPTREIENAIRAVH